VHHKGHLIPAMSEGYEAKIRKRGVEANRPKKQLIKLYHKDTDIDMGKNLKMLQSGAAQTNAVFTPAGVRPSCLLPCALLYDWLVGVI
jgi:hypothetical protein